MLDSNKQLERRILKAVEESKLQAAGQAAALSADLKKLTAVTHDQRRRVIDHWQVENSQDLTELLGRFSQATQAEDCRRIVRLILHSLDFPELDVRHEMIPKAHAATFDWVFNKEPTQSIPWSNFVDWLSISDSNKKIYWVTGKPGSGKSTLMRYLSGDSRTRSHLQHWAGLKGLVIAKCFFWNAGSEMQKSQNGLLRSLLVQLLPHISNLTEEVNPWRWQSYKLGAERLVPWTSKELMDCLKFAIRQIANSANLCLFIDGLDEFEGNDAARIELISLLTELSLDPSVKLCVSSRPHLIFKDAFERFALLQLHHLTRNDIDRHIQDKLVGTQTFLALKHRDGAGCAQLAQDIVEKAQGVFLWVSLVVRDLSTCLCNGDGIFDLRRKLEAIPSDLHKYFASMMHQLDDFYLEQAYELFQVATSAETPLSLLTYSYIHQGHEDGQLAPRKNVLIENEVSDRCQNMERRLMSRCKGLLEVYHTPTEHFLFRDRVDFLHRTVRDFLLTEGWRPCGKWCNPNPRGAPHSTLIQSCARHFYPRSRS